MRFCRIGILPLALLLVCGCAPSRNTEILEARLRQQEDRLADVETQLSVARTEARVARKEANALQVKFARRGDATILPEQANLLYRVERIELSKLMTGSLDRDGRPGDEMVSAVLLPLDEQGSLVKVPGRVELELLDVARPNDSQRIGHWTFDADEASDHWHRGLISSGYVFQLPWQQAPTSKRLMIHARLTTVDGRTFEATREISVDLPGDEPNRLRFSER